jgi:hypothetical protein
MARIRRLWRRLAQWAWGPNEDAEPNTAEPTVEDPTPPIV